jgi:DNA-binding NtrC family response regulator
MTVPRGGIDLSEVERALIQFALVTHGGNRTHAAIFLRLSRSALLYRLQKYSLASPDGRRPDIDERR